MKTYNLIFFLAIVVGIVLQGCKDNILTPVTSNKSADSLIAIINGLNSTLVSVNSKDNTLKIQLAKFQSTRDSLNALSKSNNNHLHSVQYTVYIIDGGNSVTGTIGNVGGGRECAGCKVSMVNGATVTVSSNGQNYTALSADGRAIFNNLSVAGLATVTVASQGYTSCTYTTYFNPGASVSTNAYGGVSSLSLSSSNFSGYSITATGVTQASTSGSGSGAVFTFVVGSNGSVNSVMVTSPGSGYKNGDLITFNGGNICDCSGSLTYSVIVNSLGNNNTGQGVAINASTNVMILPTAGKDVTTYTGQLYINKSALDDTLGRIYNNPSDPARYQTFISNTGPYHGYNYTGHYSTTYSQNQYASQPSGTSVNFTNLTTLAGVNFIYGYPSYVSNYYVPYSLNYQFLPGDIISITYSGLTSFATISTTGSYTLAVPSYQNNPGATIGTASGLQYGNGGNTIHYQDNFTYLSNATPLPAGATTIALNSYDPSTYAVTKITTYYPLTKMFDYYPFIETDNGNYEWIDGNGNYATLYGLPGQTVARNIFFFPFYPTGN